jgi:excinuclease ABC subunit C
VGPARKKALLKRFGSLTRLRRAEVEQIAETPGIGPDLATAIHDRLREPASPNDLPVREPGLSGGKVSA